MEREQGAIEITFEGETEPSYVVLSVFQHGNSVTTFLVPAGFAAPFSSGQHVLTAADVRGSWDAWVSERIQPDQIMTRAELDERYPGIAIY